MYTFDSASTRIRRWCWALECWFNCAETVEIHVAVVLALTSLKID